MPKARKPKSESITKSKTTNSTASAASTTATTKKTKADRPKDPKTSHLYTDDNPSTTLHGTGFKDAEAAEHTLKLVSKRSLTYQFQTINTMYNRAKHHPHPTPAMKSAMQIYTTWLKSTYPATKKSLRASGFKPVVSKDTVTAYAALCRSKLSAAEVQFLDVYLELGKNKRLANVLVEEGEPGGRDWEQERYEGLCGMVPEGKEDVKGWQDGELWEEGSKEPTVEHLRLIAWGWSPVPGRTLAGRAKELGR